jgi:hypothetical protein
MKKGARGIVTEVRAELPGGRLRVMAHVRLQDGPPVEAQMPDREVSALLPRSVLVGSARTAPLSLLETLQPILVRMTEGREVRAWQYKERWFFSFIAWRGVRFVPESDLGPGGPEPQDDAAGAPRAAPPDEGAAAQSA